MSIPPLLSSILVFIASVASGILGLWPTAVVFDSMNWCCFHSWALIHGSGVLAFLFWAYLGFHIAKLIAGARGQFALVPNAAYLCSALGTMFSTGGFVAPGLLFCGLGIYRRRRQRDKAAAGLLWTAVVVNGLNLVYTLYITILIMIL